MEVDYLILRDWRFGDERHFNQLRDEREIGKRAIACWVGCIEAVFFESRANDGSFVSFRKGSRLKRYIDEHGKYWNKNRTKVFE